MADNDDLLDYEEEETTDQTQVVDSNTDVAGAKKEVKGTYVSIHSSGFRDFLLKPEILRAIIDCGFEHPSEVQHECIPQAVLGIDILCQAKSGMGKTAVFVLATLQQLEPVDGNISVLVMCHTRELAFQISKEYERFSKYMPTVKVAVFFGGLPMEKDVQVLKNNCPHIVVGTPGRILALVKAKKLTLKNVKQFILDECDKMLEALDMRRDVQEIFRNTPHEKQVMMFSATLSKEIRPVCKKFMQDVILLSITLLLFFFYHYYYSYCCLIKAHHRLFFESPTTTRSTVANSNPESHIIPPAKKLSVYETSILPSPQSFMNMKDTKLALVPSVPPHIIITTALLLTLSSRIVSVRKLSPTLVSSAMELERSVR